MRVSIRERNISITKLLRAHVERRLDFALARFSNQVHRVSVHLSGGDGKRDGEAKRCRIDVGLSPTRLRVEDADTDLFAAVTAAANRLSRSVARAVERDRLWGRGIRGS